jgi:hypothetical protein
LTERRVVRAHLLRNTVHLRGPDRAVLDIQPFTRLGGSPDAIAAEGIRLLEFAAPAATHDVRFAPLP